MNWRSTIVLSAVFAALSSYLLFYEAKLPPPQEREAAARKLLSFDPREVTRLQIRLGDAVTVCERKGERWHLVHPVAARADARRVAGLLRRLADAESVRAFEPDGPWGPPRAEITLWIGEKPAAIGFGENTPLGPNLYVKIEGESQIRVVAASLFGGVIVNADDLRDRRVLDFRPRDVAAFEVVSSRGRVRVERNRTRWVSGQTECDPGKVGGFLHRLAALEALEFLPPGEPPDPKKWGLEKPQIEVKLELAGGETARLAVGGVRQEAVSVYAAGGAFGHPFAVSVEEKGPLAVNLDDFKMEP